MRRIPIVTKYLLIINTVMFLLSMLLGGTLLYDGRPLDLNDFCGLYYFGTDKFHLYQLLTYMFMHGSWTHLFFNMFALWMFGCVVENVWGTKKFIFYYILCGIGAGLTQELVQFMGLAEPYSATVGASGAIYAILLAFGMIFPEERIFIFPLPIPIKAKWFVIFYALVELYFARYSSGDGVAHFAHLGGMLFGFLLIRYWKKHPSQGYGRSNGQQFFDNMRRNWERRSNKSADVIGQGQRRETDWEYNARKKAEQEEIDRILDKIRRSGYDSLSRSEKQRLFEQSNRQ